MAERMHNSIGWGCRTLWTMRPSTSVQPGASIKMPKIPRPSSTASENPWVRQPQKHEVACEPREWSKVGHWPPLFNFMAWRFFWNCMKRRSSNWLNCKAFKSSSERGKSKGKIWLMVVGKARGMNGRSGTFPSVDVLKTTHQRSLLHGQICSNRNVISERTNLHCSQNADNSWLTCRLLAASQTHSKITSGVLSRYARLSAAWSEFDRSSRAPCCDPALLYGWQLNPANNVPGRLANAQTSLMVSCFVMSPQTTVVVGWHSRYFSANVSCFSTAISTLTLHSLKPHVATPTPEQSSTMDWKSQESNVGCCMTTDSGCTTNKGTNPALWQTTSITVNDLVVGSIAGNPWTRIVLRQGNRTPTQMLVDLSMQAMSKTMLQLHPSPVVWSGDHTMSGPRWPQCGRSMANETTWTNHSDTQWEQGLHWKEVWAETLNKKYLKPPPTIFLRCTAIFSRVSRTYQPFCSPTSPWKNDPSECPWSAAIYRPSSWYISTRKKWGNNDDGNGFGCWVYQESSWIPWKSSRPNKE